jgi:acyl-CoA synthetase (AMP-forming)/AMP-acid ligase II
LQDLGIRADRRVALLLDNHADHFILAFALMKLRWI